MHVQRLVSGAHLAANGEILRLTIFMSCDGFHLGLALHGLHLRALPTLCGESLQEEASTTDNVRVMIRFVLNNAGVTFKESFTHSKNSRSLNPAGALLGKFTFFRCIFGAKKLEFIPDHLSIGAVTFEGEG